MVDKHYSLDCLARTSRIKGLDSTGSHIASFYQNIVVNTLSVKASCFSLVGYLFRICKVPFGTVPLSDDLLYLFEIKINIYIRIKSDISEEVIILEYIILKLA